MTRRLAPIASLAWRSAIALLTIEIATVSLMRYVTNSQAPPDVILANAFARPFLILHVLGGVTALLLGPLQFVRCFRTRTPRVHRISGHLYVAACAIGAPAGFMLALGTRAGAVAGVGFAIPALLWPVFTWFGWRAAVERRFGDHRIWMLRSYAITSTAITLRIMLPLSGVLGFGFLPAYQTIAWLSWMTNLAGLELYLRRGRPSAKRSRKLAIV